MSLEEIKSVLRKKIGISREDFKYFGGRFTYYEQFCEYQHKKIEELSANDTRAVLYFIDLIELIKPRHIDFYNTGEQFAINGVYFHENGKLVTFSRP